VKREEVTPWEVGDAVSSGTITIYNILVSIFWLVVGVVCVVYAFSGGGLWAGLVGAGAVLYGLWPVIRFVFDL